MKKSRFLPIVLCSIALFVLIYFAHLLFSHDEIIQFSSFSELIHEKNVSWKLFFETVFIFSFALSCITICKYLSKAFSSGLLPVEEIHVTKDLVTSKELMLSILFEVILAIVFSVFAFSSYDIYSKVSNGAFPVYPNWFEMIPCVLFPMCGIGIVSFVIFSIYKPVNPTHTDEFDAHTYEREFRDLSFRKIINIVSVSTVILSIIEYLAFNSSTFSLVSDGLNKGLTVLPCVAIITKTILSFLGLNVLISGIISVILENINGLGRVLTQIVSVATKVVLFFVCTILCLKVLNVDTYAIVTGCGIIGVGGSFCLKDMINDILSSVVVIQKNKLSLGDYITSNATGYISSFDNTGLSLVSEGGRTYANYSSLYSITRYSFPYTCGKVSFSISNVHKRKTIQNILEEASPEIVENSNSVINAVPIFQSCIRGFSLFSTYTYLIPTTLENKEAAENYAKECFAKILKDHDIVSHQGQK